MNSNKIFIYQALPRLLGNTNDTNKPNGSIEENGSGKLKDISAKFLNTLKRSGYTHIWLIGVLAHASKTDYTQFGIPQEHPEIIKGNAGSPYAIRDYYDIDPDLAVNVNKRMDEFEATVDRIHKSGLKLIIDFVPNHVARNYNSINRPPRVADFGSRDKKTLAFSASNNFYYLPGQDLNVKAFYHGNNAITYKESPAKATGNDAFTAQPSVYDWYETVKLNYGVDYQGGGSKYFDPIPDTWKKMKNILLYWASKGTDGFRCDMAEMVPTEFWQWVIPQVKKKYPGILFIAEIYNPTLYRSFLDNDNFDYLYDKVGLYDVLRDVACGYRPSSDITFALNSVGDIQHKMLNFVENHDEQRIASDFFLKSSDKSEAAMIVTSCINTNPVMVYFGQELGERGMDEEGFSGRDGRTTIFDYWSIDTVRRWNNNGKWNNDELTEKEINLKDFYSKLLNLCNKESSLREGKFYDLMFANYQNTGFDSTRQYAFLRGTDEELSLVVANFSNEEVEITIDIPDHAFSFFNLSKKYNFTAFPLLSSFKNKISFSRQDSIKLKIEANSGEIYNVSGL